MHLFLNKWDPSDLKAFIHGRRSTIDANGFIWFVKHWFPIVANRVRKTKVEKLSGKLNCVKIEDNLVILIKLFIVW